MAPRLLHLPQAAVDLRPQELLADTQVRASLGNLEGDNLGLILGGSASSTLEATGVVVLQDAP